MSKDPRELNNLAGISELAEVRGRLQALLHEADPTAADSESRTWHFD